MGLARGESLEPLLTGISLNVARLPRLYKMLTSDLALVLNHGLKETRFGTRGRLDNHNLADGLPPFGDELVHIVL
jgi:hypothetical protein